MPQSQQKTKDALERYLTGTGSPEETAIIEQWFEKEVNIHKPGMQLSADEKDRLLHRIHTHQSMPEKPRKQPVLFRFGWQAAAISAALLLVTSMLLWKAYKKPVTYAEIKTGTGEMKKITLPDSSVVFVNANSILRYPSDFISNRQLLLTGEAVFHVIRDEEHPFIVTTEEGIYTTVLGTDFNVQAYRQAKELHVAVLSGKVKISKADNVAGILVAEQALHYNKETHRFTRQTVAHPEVYSNWIRGIWQYEHFSFAELVLLLQNQYGVTIRSNKSDTLSLQIKASINFNKEQKVTDILDFFCGLTNTRYRKTGNAVMEIY